MRKSTTYETAITTLEALARQKDRMGMVEYVLDTGFVPPAFHRNIWRVLTRLSEGNNKLKGDSDSKFLIWNLPAVTTCPFATTLCRSNCYARKSETQYPQVLPFRQLNYRLAQWDKFNDFMEQNILYHVTKPSFSDKAVYFRIHESGDFFSPEYVKAWYKVINRMAWLTPSVRFTVYTKSLVYLQGARRPKGLKVYYSVWHDTLPVYKDMAKRMKLPVFSAIEPTEYDDRKELCAGDCSTCKSCYDDSKNDVQVIIH